MITAVTRMACAMLALAPLAPLALSAQLSRPLDSQANQVFRWRSIGPSNMAARVTDIEAVVGNPKIYYIVYAASGIWKTSNGGTTFTPIFDTQDVISMGDLAIAPSNPNILYAGTGEEDGRNSVSPGGGVYRSIDAGRTWTRTGLENTRHIGRIVVHPTNPDIAWVAALGNMWAPSPERGMYRTANGGRTWELTKFVSPNAGFIDVAVNPKDPNVLWATSYEFRRGPFFMRSGGPGSGLWKSTDGGRNWREITGNGFPAQQKGRIAIDVHRANPRILYAMVEADTAPNPAIPTGPRRVYNYPGDPGDPELYGIGLDIYPLEKTASGLYRSDDGGESWRQVNKSNTRPFYFSLVRVDPVDPNRVYWGNNEFYFSDDGGITANRGAYDIHIDWHAMWINPNADNFGAWFTALTAHDPSIYSVIERHVKQYVPDFKDIRNPLVGIEQRSLFVQFAKGDSSATIPFREISNGEKCYVLGAMVLAAAQSYGPLLCFWDEPDSHLAISEVGQFIMELRRAGKVQFIATSNNPEVIRKFSDENTLLLERPDHFSPPIARRLNELTIHGDLVEALVRGDVHS